MVAGGRDENGDYLSSTEIMPSSGLSWAYAAALPSPCMGLRVVLNLNNEVIQPVDAARLLGIQITKDLSQNYYINDMQGENLLSQVESRFKAFNLLSKMTSVAKLKQLGYGIIVSKLAFGVTFWANAPDYLLNKVDVFLNKLRLIIKFHFLENI